jgi:hypothetical protein
MNSGAELSIENNLDNTINRVLRATARLHWEANLVESIRDDETAECRWWNALHHSERVAYARGAGLDPTSADSDWLDIGGNNRSKILAAAHAVQCWLAETD